MVSPLLIFYGFLFVTCWADKCEAHLECGENISEAMSHNCVKKHVER